MKGLQVSEVLSNSDPSTSMKLISCFVTQDNSIMAGEIATDLETRIAEIEEALSLWSQLADHLKKPFKTLIDLKMDALTGSACNKNINEFEFLKQSLELQKKIITAGFNSSSVDAVVSKEVERLLLNAGLGYDEASKLP